MKKLYIPSNLDLPNILELNKKSELDKFYYLIHLIYEQRVLYKMKDDFIPLKSTYLRKIIKNYNSYRDLLIDKSIINCDNYYIKSRKSYGYQIATPYSEVKVKQIELTNPILLRNLNIWQIKRLPTTDIHLHLYEFLKEIDINHCDASTYIENLPISEYNSAKIAIDKFLNKDFFFYSDEYGRIHSNVTNLKSNIRKFLLYKGNTLYNIDIVNSQPLILLILLFSKTQSHLHPIRCTFSNFAYKLGGDLHHYKTLVEEGKLYDFIMEKTGDTDRELVKTNLFREVLFGKRVSKFFADLFPTIAEMLVNIKKGDYRKLAWNMQRAESNLIINRICRRIMQEHPDCFISTIHDSILTTQENILIVKQIMQEEFKVVGLNPKIRVELA